MANFLHTLTRRAAITIAIGAPLLIAGCDDKAGADVESVKIKGSWFHLELAVDQATQMKGLGGRDFIASDGGMIFVFANPAPLYFVMRDCAIPIDIAFLDGAGGVLAVHHMVPDPPMAPDESDQAYEARLKRYDSRFPAQFAIETAGGRLGEIGLKEGDHVKLDALRLKRLVR